MSGQELPPPLDSMIAVPTRRDAAQRTGPDLAGTDLDGAPSTVAVRRPGRWTLVLFLSSRCDGCRSLWAATGDPVGSGLVRDEDAVVVTRDAGVEDVGELRALAGRGVPVVMSSESWKAYGVLGPPFFALVDGTTGRVVTEGVGWALEQVAADVTRARPRWDEASVLRPPSGAGEER